MSAVSGVIGTKPMLTPISKIRSCQAKRNCCTAVRRPSPDRARPVGLDVFQEDAELVAAQPGQGVGLAQPRP